MTDQTIQPTSLIDQGDTRMPRQQASENTEAAPETDDSPRDPGGTPRLPRRDKAAPSSLPTSRRGFRHFQPGTGAPTRAHRPIGSGRHRSANKLLDVRSPNRPWPTISSTESPY